MATKTIKKRTSPAVSIARSQAALKASNALLETIETPEDKKQRELGQSIANLKQAQERKRAADAKAKGANKQLTGNTLKNIERIKAVGKTLKKK